MKVNFEKLVDYCRREYDIIFVKTDYLGKGIMGRFFPPNVILICPGECSNDNCYGQRKVLVFLHEMCHYLKYLEHIGDYSRYDEEECFEFEVICNEILNNGYIGNDFESIKRLGLEKGMELLEYVKKNCME